MLCTAVPCGSLINDGRDTCINSSNFEIIGTYRFIGSPRKCGDLAESKRADHTHVQYWTVVTCQARNIKGTTKSGILNVKTMFNCGRCR